MAQTRTRRSATGRTRSARTKNTSTISWEIPWTNMNLIGLAVGLGVILIGYWLMSTAIVDEPLTDKSEWNNAAATVVAPIVLTIAYCVIVPIAIFWRRRSGRTDEATETAEA